MNENAYSSYPKGANAATDEDDSINIQQLVQLCVSNWYWFLASIIVALALAAAYILTTQPVYTRKASVLIKDGVTNSAFTKAFSSFTSMGNTYTRTNLHNEMLTFKSPTYMIDVVVKLHLDMNYSIDGRFHAVELYGSRLPIQISLPDLEQDETAAFDIRLSSDGKAILSNFVLNNEPVSDKTYQAQVGTVVQTPIGKMLIAPTQAYDGSAWT